MGMSKREAGGKSPGSRMCSWTYWGGGGAVAVFQPFKDYGCRKPQLSTKDHPRSESGASEVQTSSDICGPEAMRPWEGRELGQSLDCPLGSP